MSADKKYEVDIEKRIRMLEEEVQKMKEPLERTLMDIRGLINELENPFEYVTKLIGTFPVRELKPDDVNTKLEQKPRQKPPPAEHTIEAAPQAYASTERHVGGHDKISERVGAYKLDGKAHRTRATAKHAQLHVLESANTVNRGLTGFGDDHHLNCPRNSRRRFCVCRVKPRLHDDLKELGSHKGRS